MICPVCKRELAPTLSICFTCGAMMNDTVREELESKIGRVSGPLSARSGELEQPNVQASTPPVRESFQPIPQMPQPARPIATPAQTQTAAPPAVKQEPAPSPTPSRSFTSQFPRKTSPTLVDFQPKAPTVPDWRLQLQNAVRQRASGVSQRTESAEPASPSLQRAPVTHGATALKAEAAPPPVTHSNDKVAAALKRIEASRKTFLPEEAGASAAKAAKPTPARNYPFNVVSRAAEPAVNTVQTAAAVTPAPSPAVKPKLVSSLRIEKKAYDTNKLPPIPKPAKIATSFDAEAEQAIITKTDVPARNHIAVYDETDLHTTSVDEPAEVTGAIEIEEIDDLPNFATRFAAGSFDLIISGAASLVILSPFMVGGSSWLSVSGGLAFLATLSLFLFLYLTASLAFWGKTFGMRIFSLELIDIEANAYPSVHQAAVSSAVYVLSMVFGGAGFLTMPFNEEKRAVHDIISGTILVREI